MPNFIYFKIFRQNSYYLKMCVLELIKSYVGSRFCTERRQLIAGFYVSRLIKIISYF